MRRGQCVWKVQEEACPLQSPEFLGCMVFCEIGIVASFSGWKDA